MVLVEFADFGSDIANFASDIGDLLIHCANDFGKTLVHPIFKSFDGMKERLRLLVHAFLECAGAVEQHGNLTDERDQGE